MPANGRWDLIRRLKFNSVIVYELRRAIELSLSLSLSPLFTIRRPSEPSKRRAELLLSSSDPPLFDSPKTYLSVVSWTEASFSAREESDAAAIIITVSCLELI